MDYSYLSAGKIHQDTISNHLPVDTIATTIAGSKSHGIDSIVPVLHTGFSISTDSLGSAIYRSDLIKSQETGESQSGKVLVYNPYRKDFRSNVNFLENNSLVFLKKNQKTAVQNDSLVSGLVSVNAKESATIRLQERFLGYGNWFFLVLLFIVLLFIWIKVFYNKFFSFIANSLVSYQLSAKLFNERNFLLRRVSLVLNVIYHFVLAIFIFEIFTYYEIYPLKLNSYNLFLFILNVLILFTLARTILLGLFNSLFQTAPIVTEYIHNNFIVNKSLGIALFPVVICIYYFPNQLTVILYFTGIFLIGIGILFKIIRAYQIIIRRDILFSYLILYLCTLEILPLFIGYKVFISLL